MSNDFDVINLKDPEGPMKQIQQQAVELLIKYYQSKDKGRDKDQLRVMALEKMKSKHLFAIESEIQYQKTPKAVIFIIVDGLVILIYQSNNSPMFEAFDLTTILKLTIGQDFPQAAAFELSTKL